MDLTCLSGVAEQTPCWEVYHGDEATDKLLLLQGESEKRAGLRSTARPL